MAALPAHLRVRLHTVETALALEVIGCAAGWLLEPEPLFRYAFVGRYLWLPASIVGPGTLGAVVSGRVLGYALRVGRAIVEGDPPPLDGSSLPALLSSIVLGALAAYTLWWVGLTVYVLYFSSAGGVLFAPLIAAVVGGAVLLEGALVRLAPSAATGDPLPSQEE